MFTPTITNLPDLPAVLETNLGDLAPIIAERVSFANGLVVNPDDPESLAACDAKAAEASKLAKRIGRFRIDLRAAWDAPFASVEAACKRYEADLNAAWKTLREKSEVGRERAREAKYTALKAMFVACLEKHAPASVPPSSPCYAAFYAAMTNPKAVGNWLLKGVSVEAAEAATRIECERLADAAKSIQAIADDGARKVAMDVLLETGDLAAAHAKGGEYVAMRKSAQEAEERAKARLAAEREKLSAQAEQAAPVAAPAPVPRAAASMPAQPDSVESYNLILTGTRADLKALRMWGEAHGVTFRRA